MNAGCRPRVSVHLHACHPLPCMPITLGKAAVPGGQTPLADLGRLGSNSQASSSSSNRSPCSKVRRAVQTDCALQSVPFRPSKLTVQYLPGTTRSGNCLLQPRRYTLTHNDLTGQLLLTIGQQYNKAQLSGWYNRLLRDEILAYWQFGNGQPVLHIECHVSGEETWLAPPILRDYIFRREMPLVLNVINFAEAELLADNPAMADATVMVHLSSHVQAYHATVPWGSLSDCSSWQPPPQWSRTRRITTTVHPLSPTIGSMSLTQRDLAALAAADEALQDQPCVLPASDIDSALQATSTEGMASICQQQADMAGCLPLKPHSGTKPASAPPPDSSHRKSRQNAACYRLHVACTAAVSGLPVHRHTPVSSTTPFNPTHHSTTPGLSYHVPPRLSRSW